MALMNVEQREIVEVPFLMPDGSMLPHPALVISKNELHLLEMDFIFFGVTTCYVTHRKTARRLKTVRQGFENVSDANLQLC